MLVYKQLSFCNKKNERSNVSKDINTLRNISSNERSDVSKDVNTLRNINNERSNVAKSIKVRPHFFAVKRRCFMER